jgi:hypothetical protein
MEDSMASWLGAVRMRDSGSGFRIIFFSLYAMILLQVGKVPRLSSSPARTSSYLLLFRHLDGLPSCFESQRILVPRCRLSCFDLPVLAQLSPGASTAQPDANETNCWGLKIA